MSENWLLKAAASEAVLNGDFHVTDDAFATRHPALFAFLASAVDPEGKPRVGCRVTIFADGGCWKATLTDPNSEHSLFVTIDRPSEAFGALDKALKADKVDWRAWRSSKPEKKSKK
jgi:hypothetical protein